MRRGFTMGVLILVLIGTDAFGAATRWGWLGVRIRDLSEQEMDDISKKHGLREGFGALIVEVMKETPAETAGLQNGDLVVAFKDIYPKAPIHLLIVPKRHIESVATLTPDDRALVGHCFLVARRIGESKGFAERGYRVSVNCGPEGGQVVYHLHFHFLAGRRGG